MMLSMWHVMAIAAGGALGALGRFAVVTWLNELFDTQFPWGTFAVNVLGSALMGLAFVVLTLKYPSLDSATRSFVMVGVLGAFTTFSSFALEGLLLFLNQQWGTAVLYMASSAVVCLFAALAGYSLGKLIL